MAAARGVLLSGWGGGLFRFPGLSRFPRAPSIFQALYLQRDSWALELFFAAGRCVTSPVPTPEDKRKSKREKGYEVNFFFYFLFFLEKRSPFRVFLDNKVKNRNKWGEMLRDVTFLPHSHPTFFSPFILFSLVTFLNFYNFLLHL